MTFPLVPSLRLLLAQNSPDQGAKPVPGLSKQSRYDIQGELTAIGQYLPPFPSRYSGVKSLPSGGRAEATETGTLYLGVRPIPNVEVYANPEIAWGSAAGAGNGLGGYLNGDLIGQQDLDSSPYLARAFVRIRIPMKQSKDQAVGKEDVGRAPNLIAGPAPAHRLVVTAGRFAASDVFDFSSYANNARTQFINNAFVNGLAYDFPQDVRGYTYGASVALVNPSYAVRFGTFAMPTTPGGEVLAYSFNRSHSENLELQINPQLLKSPKPSSIVRLLVYRNIGSMGSYSDALQAAVPNTVPNLGDVRRDGTTRWGGQLSFEQGLADGGATGVFARAGLADGSIEADSYSEADQAASLGGQLSGARWKRKDDVLGVAFGVGGLGSSHQRYLEAGGTGLTLGDGNLRYGAESIAETYYLYQATKRVQLSLDLQYISNPGFNSARGPAPVFSIRAHYTF